MPAVNDFNTVDTPAPMQPQAPATNNGKSLAVKTLCNGSIMLFHDDCFNVLKHLKAGSVAMVFADLPYGTTACAWDSLLSLPDLWQALTRVADARANYVFTANQPFTTTLIASNINNFAYEWVWNKKKPGNIFLAKTQPMRIHESVIVFHYGKARYNPQMVARDKIKISHNYGAKDSIVGVQEADEFDRVYTHKNPQTIIEFSNADQTNKRHPTQKPIKLLEYLIETYTNPGDLVLDPTMGSGTTAIACKHLNRRCIGIEKYPLVDQPISKNNPDHFNTAVDRVMKE